MNVLHKVTLQALKQNRTRTIVTIIGIILSTAMLCAVTTFTTSFQQFMLDDSVYSSGSWHLGQTDATYRVYQELSQADGVAEAVYLQHLGYAKSGTNLDESMPYLYVLGLSPQGTDLLPLRLSQGRMPTASNEIVLFQSFLDASTQYYQPGDTITLGLGQRMSDGFALGEQNPFNYDDGETLDVRETRTYTVVGICNWWGLYSYTSPGYPAFTVADSNLAEDATCDVYLAMEDMTQAYDFQQAHDLEQDNRNVLMYSGVSEYDTFYTVLYRLAAIVMVIIIAASVVLIYNAFAISVSERTRQFGLLSSLGATKKQMRNMVRFEALVLSAIGVPLGILSGIGGIGITLHFIGTLFTFSRSTGSVPMRLHVSWVGILVAVVLGVVTVLLSAWIPSRRATKVSAMEAIRQSQDIHGTKKLVRPSLLTRKLFGLPGVLGVKYYKRSAKKYRTTVFSLFLSVVLFVSASSFSSSLAKSVGGAFGGDTYDLSFPFYTEDTDLSPDTLLDQLQGLDSVDDSAYVLSFQLTGGFRPEDLSQDMQALSTPVDGTIYQPFDLSFVDDDTYQALCAARKLDPAATSGIAFDGITEFDSQQEKYVYLYQLEASSLSMSALIFDQVANHYPDSPVEGLDGTVQVPYIDADNGTPTLYPLEDVAHTTPIEVTSVEKEWPYFLSNSGLVTVLYPMSQLEEFPVDLSRGSYYFYIMALDHQQAEQDIKDLLGKQQLRPGNLFNNAEYDESNRNLITIINVFSYGFIALISLVAMTNVFNTISTNVMLRTRDFAMLQSVGMTRREMRRMLGFECVLYGTRALILGIPVSIFISYLIYDAIAQGYPLPFQVPWIPLGIACLSVFLVVFATMAYAARKVSKQQLVEALKNENL